MAVLGFSELHPSQEDDDGAAINALGDTYLEIDRNCALARWLQRRRRR
jgi:hypothetical protein